MVVGTRANELAQNYSVAYSQRMADEYAKFISDDPDVKINALQLRANMAKFNNEWQLENRLFDETTLQAVGRGSADELPENAAQAKAMLIRDYVSRGTEPDEAKRLAEEDLAGTEQYRTYKTYWQNYYNQQLAKESDVVWVD